ncbi:MAG: SUMF1/EgtB/PvdO family nonheme iron enzyme, partial [Magnetococcales bacterium]|nr:SUMF1/EgtB/PvdO family nonheme iron enzyme [Magnetococcales bacterium]
NPTTATGAVFDDVSADYWAGNFIEKFSELGITSGCTDSTYCPSREISRSEMAVFLVRAKYGVDYAPPTATGSVFGDIASDYWAASYIEKLAEEGYTDNTIEPGRECDGEGDYCPSLTINRAEMALFLVQTFQLEGDSSGSSDDTYTNSLNMDFVRIASGTFEMGCEDDDSESGYACYVNESPLHTVTITEDFFMQTTEVTQAQWQSVMGSNPAYFANCGDDCPIEEVSWNDVQDFITAMNDLGEGSYRLPTEAEWEYACLAGTTTTWPFGDDDEELANHGWYSSNSNSQIQPVGGLTANAWGLYDMQGNAWEWVQDLYDSHAYDSHASEDPLYEESGTTRVRRGGGWNSNANGLRCRYRQFYLPTNNIYTVGLRLVREP